LAKLPEIASLWIGGRLSWLEQLCLKSFADAGHSITLYSYAPIDNVPEGVETADAAQILPGEPMLRHARTGSPAIHADMWRLQLLRKTNKIWVDADIYCYRPFDFTSEFVFGWEKPGLVCNAVLGLPKISKTLAGLLAFFEDQYAIGPWLADWQKQELQAERDAGSPVHMTAQNWGFTGPASVTHFLQESGEISHALQRDAFYPISFKNRNQLILSRFSPQDEMTENTYGVHFWARRMKPRLEEKEGNSPRRGSFMHGLLKKHDIVPEDAPIPAKIARQHEKADDPAFRALIGAEALRGDVSIDHISRKYLVEKRFIKDCRQEASDTATGLEDQETTRKSVMDVDKQEMPFEVKVNPVEAAKLDYSMFDDQDLLNLILQRSEILFDVPKSGRLIKEWSNGSTMPLQSIVAEKGPVLAARAARVIGEEFDQLRPILDDVPTKRIADIGCGYALFDLFMARAYGSEIVLIDSEENDHRNFAPKDQDTARSLLSKASEFLECNEVAAQSVKRVNPENDDIMAIEPVDIAVSLLACGFHFPIDAYLPFFEKKVRPGGHIILDVRRHSSEVQMQKLSAIGEVSVLNEAEKRLRIMVKKHD
jgi:SAM-dependent methyltransferase